jgi:hypothetical protein
VETSIRNGVNKFAKAFNTGEPQRYMGDFFEEKARCAIPK